MVLVTRIVTQRIDDMNKQALWHLIQRQVPLIEERIWMDVRQPVNNTVRGEIVTQLQVESWRRMNEGVIG